MYEVIKMTRIVNLTPHPVKLFTVSGEAIVINPTTPTVRLTEHIQDKGFITNENGEKIRLIEKTVSEVINEPPKLIDTVFIVSLPVAQALHRDDVFAIGESIRDEKGNVIGAKSLAVVV